METLVALVVLSIGITMVLQLFSGALNAKSRSEEHTRAVFRASEAMELLLAHPYLLEAPLSGEFEDGFSWTAELTEEIDETELEEDPVLGEDPVLEETGPRLYRVSVEVAWLRGETPRTYRLETLSLVFPRPEI
jgi:hypothetical protein